MKYFTSVITGVLVLLLSAQPADGCTSAIISGRLTANGRPMLWKNRDTGARSNFIARVASPDGEPSSIPFTALFNEGDSLLTEAWMGMNDNGFAIMNTASYNLAPDTARVKDREGIVMALALSRCSSLADFETLLDTLPRPMGVQANFGVLDRYGNAAYYETDDVSYTKFDLADAPEGFIVRSNYSEAGETDGGYGYIRRDNALKRIKPAANGHRIDYRLFTDSISRSFYHSLLGRDMIETDCPYLVDLDFVPRASTTASVVIEGLLPDENPATTPVVMWTTLGYPPASFPRAVIGGDIPEQLRPAGHRHSAPANEDAITLTKTIFDITRGNGPKYMNVTALRDALRLTATSPDIIALRLQDEQRVADARPGIIDNRQK